MSSPRLLALLLPALFPLLILGCRQPPAPTGTPTVPPPVPGGHLGASDEAPGEGTAELALSSPAFGNGDRMPVKYTQDGDNLSPPLEWSPPPDGTWELALLCVDPDAPGGDFVHWVVHAIAPGVKGLPEGLPGKQMLDAPALRQGRNGAGQVGYLGPAPPPGKVHHYRFTLLALSGALNLPPFVDRAQLERAAQGKILASATLVGTYSR